MIAAICIAIACTIRYTESMKEESIANTTASSENKDQPKPGRRGMGAMVHVYIITGLALLGYMAYNQTQVIKAVRSIDAGHSYQDYSYELRDISSKLRNIESSLDGIKKEIDDIYTPDSSSELRDINSTLERIWQSMP